MWQFDIPSKAKPLGYKYLVEKFDIKVLDHFCWSYSSPKWEKKILHYNDQNLTINIIPVSQQQPKSIFEHLEFALKNEGTNLAILKKVLSKISKEEFLDYISSKPNGKYARVLWFLYEKWNKIVLPLNDLENVSYFPILDPKKYYTGISKKSLRHRISINLIGSLDFAPILRKTPILQQYEAKKLNQLANELTKKYDPSLLARAMRYLYTKETMSSWEIEKEKPDQSKLAAFVKLLYKADSIGDLSEKTLVELQKNIVDIRFALDSYRTFQNYVGEEPGLGQMIMHYICPKPENVRELMEQLLAAFNSMEQSKIDPVITAAMLSFGFVFIHPFEVGNGRIHRFLIHYTLSRLGFTPPGILFPISAAISKDPLSYDKALESFSKPLLNLITDYKINELGELQVNQSTHDFYTTIDFTPLAEYLYKSVEKTIATDFQGELAFLAEYDKIKRQCKEIIDMPDQKIDLFIKFVRQNDGKLSLKKRKDFFNMLTDDEIRQLEEIINNQ